MALIIPLLLVTGFMSCNCDHLNGFGVDENSDVRFGQLLKPPPPPLAPIVPVPFHGGSNRPQRENLDVGYHYPPPSPSPQSIVPPSDFKFPAPFYKQYNFNFVPPPQPFLTTPSPSLFQKVSTWLFPSQQTSYDSTLSNNLGPIKKDCNPCNLVPWIPVIKYKSLGHKIVKNPIPTYGPPSPTAFANVQNAIQYHPQPFQSQIEERLPPHFTPGTPIVNYRPPALPIQTPTVSSVGAFSSTYGPPSPTHTLEMNTQRPHSSTFSLPLSTYGLPSHTYGVPNRFVSQPSTSYLPGLPNGILDTNFLASSTYRTPTTYSFPSSSYLSPSPSYGTPYPVTTYESVTPPYESKVPEKEKPPQSDVEILRDNIEPLEDLQLPNVNHPTRFKNSYGEPIINTNIYDIPYPVSATAAESTKIRTEVLPNATYKTPTPNVSLALSNPSPFSLNRGRNIHTLQPVALPNLSVSPLPPIFNARPFRPVTPFPSNIVNGINHMQHVSNIVNIAQSIPLLEFTHSVDYPATYIQAPVIDIDSSKPVNQSKSYRNIPNSFVIDEVRDISSQASEDHISATKTGSDVSFESTGTDVGNDIYDSSIPTELKFNVQSNHKTSFTDLRGVKDEDVDKFRTESNLQNIDSPLLYLKPSAPHKSHGDFLIAVSTPVASNEYDIYDDIPTTLAPLLPTINTWDEDKTDYNEKILPPTIQKDIYKPKIVQIIVPYTIGEKEIDTNENFTQRWTNLSEEDHQARKVPLNTDKPHLSTENYDILTTTTTQASVTTGTDNYDPDQSNPTLILNDFYDVKEPPFDIIKLQHTIDDWTEQEFSKDYKIPQRTRSSDKYAKQIPDEYFTTTMPTNYPTDPETYNYELYDHESASSIQHSVTEERNSTFNQAHKEYNTIERNKGKQNNNKNEDLSDVQKFHIYTAASSFRTTSTSTTSTTTTTTTTPAPWGKIQTSISPLTKEKVYVVTSKPWRDTRNFSNEWYSMEPFKFESKKTTPNNDAVASDNLPFKSPRFINRPSFGFTSGGKVESTRSDVLIGFSKSWYQSINDLENQAQSTITPLIETPSQKESTNSDEVL